MWLKQALWDNGQVIIKFCQVIVTVGINKHSIHLRLGGWWKAFALGRAGAIQDSRDLRGMRTVQGDR